MTKHTPPLYALTKITDTEGLANDQYRLLDKYGRESKVKYSFDDGRWIANVAIELYQFTHYMRPLPEGTVAVSEEDLLKISEWMNDVGREQNHYQIFKGVTLNVKLLLQLYKKGLKPVDALNDLSTIC